MAEQATIYQIVNIGKETVSGTAVSADKRLSSLLIEPQIKSDIARYRGTGYKFGTITLLNKEWVEASLSGPITYTDLTYLMASLINDETPTAGTTDQTWVFSPDSDGADDPATFTVEYGDATRAQEFAYGLVNALTLTFSRDGAELSGTMLGQALTDGITLTSTPTAIALVPVFPTQTSVYLEDSAAALSGATALTRAISAEWSMTDRYNPAYFLDGSTSYDVHVEVEPTAKMKLKMEADATGMGLLTQMRAGSTKFMRIEAVGAVVGSANYTLTIDGACKVVGEPTFSDEDGIRANELDFDLFHDSTWGKATEVTLINELSSL